MKDSNFLSLGVKDILRGLLIAVLTPVNSIQLGINSIYIETNF